MDRRAVHGAGCYTRRYIEGKEKPPAVLTGGLSLVN
jgi:hypothetical protein